jgi:5'(3')-deoxyribonucleotidase
MGKAIALDLDGVIADIGEALTIALEIKGHFDYDYTDWLTTHHECSLSDEIMEEPLFWKNLKPFEDAWYQVNKWFAQGTDVYIVTARRSEVSIGVTQDWLDQWNIGTMAPIFCSMGDKHNVINELNAQFVVEDNPHEVITLLEEGHNAFLRKAWYNKKYWNKLPTIGSLLELEIND